VPPRLTVISGPWKNNSFPVTAPLSIGSDPSNAVRLEDPAVAPQHCSITASSGCFTLRDLDSPAGTFVNGIPICERVLAFGDQISIGDSSSFSLKSRQAPKAVPWNLTSTPL
jgi:pSer/pThr/pTyr-binding forkhead associated (FHA) protein